MGIPIIDTMTDGFERATTRNGLRFVAVFAILSIASVLLSPMRLDAGEPAVPIVGFGGAVAGLLSIVVAIATVVAAIVALRTFAAGETETIPDAFVRRNVGWATLNVILGGIAFGLIVAFGTVLFVVPGLFLLVSLYYWAVFVAVEDQNALEGFRSSWQLTRGNRLRLFGLGVAVFVTGAVVTAAFALPVALLGIVGGVLAQVVSAAITVYVLATTVSAYEQLRDGGPSERPDTQPFVPGTTA
ncbi:hypothetical protein [Natronosalvus caseinilyticus]|uniref:hypothetical protein n=1 Tax=Natronosalvus caseinilyticus TaxID=2953747 RepID=UPI0028A7033B|nr:hypothetical protein [Natronosalvus caseinilyticus]